MTKNLSKQIMRCAESVLTMIAAIYDEAGWIFQPERLLKVNDVENKLRLCQGSALKAGFDLLPVQEVDEDELSHELNSAIISLLIDTVRLSYDCLNDYLNSPKKKGMLIEKLSNLPRRERDFAEGTLRGLFANHAMLEKQLGAALGLIKTSQ